jgi:hypothetical protein
MTRSHKILGFLFVVVVGAYGCARVPVGSGGTEKSTSLEAKAQRLEQDFRAAAAARDQFKQKLLAAEEEQTRLQRQLDQERAEVKARIAERDTIATQYDGFRKSLKELIAQAESTLANPSLATQSAPVGVNVHVAPMPTEVRADSRN